MPDLSNVSNVVANLWEITIDGNLAPFHSTLSASGFGGKKEPIVPQRFGASIGRMVVGHEIVGEVTFLQATEDEFKMFMGGVETSERMQMPAIGSHATQHLVNFHDPKAGEDRNGDINIAKLVWLEFRLGNVEGKKSIIVPFTADMRAADGVTAWVGPPES